MNTSLLLALALAGQCAGGYCPRPTTYPGWTWTYPAVPAVQVAQVQTTPPVQPTQSAQAGTPAPYDIEENGTKLRVWGTARYEASANRWTIDWDRDHQPAGYPVVLNRPVQPKGEPVAGATGTMNFGVDLSHEAKTAAVESTDPNIGAILTPPEGEKPRVQAAGLTHVTTKDQPDVGDGWFKNPFRPDTIDTTTPALIVGGAILLGLVVIARSRSREEE